MYVIGMRRKLDGAIYLNSKSGGAAGKTFDNYIDALEEISRLAVGRSEEYEYLVLKVVASATIANKPIVLKEF